MSLHSQKEKRFVSCFANRSCAAEAVPVALVGKAHGKLCEGQEGEARSKEAGGAQNELKRRNIEAERERPFTQNGDGA